MAEMKFVQANAAGVVEAVEHAKGFLGDYGVKK